MKRFKRILIGFFIFMLFVKSHSQLLPEGEYHRNRDRYYDILHYKADLRFHFQRGEIKGISTIKLIPLVELEKIFLDAIRLDIQRVRLLNLTPSKQLPHSLQNRLLEIDIGKSGLLPDTLVIEIQYSCRPNAGMFFQKRSGGWYVHSYGEGGLHANWIPVYNEVNDKFSSEMLLTVPAPYTAVSNGTLTELLENEDNTRTFHWKQSLPHSNYLMALYIGNFEEGQLRPAFGSIPLKFWVPAGRLPEGDDVFRNTGKMVEFFSDLFNYPYPWGTYNQVVMPDYAIGAMEHTGVSGFHDSILRKPLLPFDFTPSFNNYYNFWTVDGIISHELAHHWFGNTVTCRNLSYIWLNESFASYCQMLWDEEKLGRETMLLVRQLALDQYFSYVNEKNIIRPLEYHYFNRPDDIFNEEHTYLKGALVLHMLRGILGDSQFFRAMNHYLKKHEFRNVDSHDLKIAIEESAGWNLDWFFEDWVYGAGHPIFEVSYRYFDQDQLLELTVNQNQAQVEGQDLFRLPVVFTVFTESGQLVDTLLMEEQQENFMLFLDEEPLAISLDGRGDLLAEIRFEKTIEELMVQMKRDHLPGRIRAVRQLIQFYPHHPKSVNALTDILAGENFWGIKAEAARQLGHLSWEVSEPILMDAIKNRDYRIRKAAVLAMNQYRRDAVTQILTDIIRYDQQTDVIATAIVVLASVDPKNGMEIIRSQIGMPSWYDEITMACLEATGIIGHKEMVETIKPYTGEIYHQDLRIKACEAWGRCAPEDPVLHRTLIKIAENSPYKLQKFAVDKLGELYIAESKSLLEKISVESGDDNLRISAMEALHKINGYESLQR